MTEQPGAHLRQLLDEAVKDFTTFRIAYEGQGASKMYSPRSLTIHEANPASVATYLVEVRHGDTVLGTATGGSDASGDTTISLNDIFNQEMLGLDVTFWVKEVGPSGAESEWQQAGFGIHFIVAMIPDGAESITVNL
jgi:hypothetical protein